MLKYYLFFFILIPCASYSILKLPTKNNNQYIIQTKLEINDNELDKKLKNFSKELIKENKIDINKENLNFWLEEWKGSIDKFLKSYGYYDCRVIFINKDENNVIFKVFQGERYTIGNIKIDINSRSVLKPCITDLTIKENDPAIAENILNTEKQIAKFIEDNNCLLHFEVSHEAFIDRKNHKININFLINAGYSAYIKDIEFIGLKSVNEKYAHKIVDKHLKGCFKYKKISNAKSALQGTALFSSVTPIVPKKPDIDNNVVIKFKTKERKQRTIKAGLKYGTDFGPGVTTEFEHRNVFGSGEKLTNKLSVTKPLKNFDTVLQIPFFLADNQILKLQNIIKKENVIAYDNKEISVLASLEQLFFEKLTLGEGIKYGYNTVKNDKGKKNYALAALPLFAKLDFRNNILDPTKGALIRVNFTPYYNTLSSFSKTFYKKELYTTLYFGADTKYKPTIALLGQIGSITGAKTKGIPATERFFSGGAGSIRGYKYQTVGPLNAKAEPIGGNSILELSAELRFKVSESIGLVGFMDAGNVFMTNTPKFKEKLLYSSGVGIRYYTNFGPLRADIAFPMKKRGKTDKSFQLYFSIGQAF